MIDCVVKTVNIVYGQQDGFFFIFQNIDLIRNNGQFFEFKLKLHEREENIKFRVFCRFRTLSQSYQL